MRSSAIGVKSLLKSTALLRRVLARLMATPVHVDEFYTHQNGLLSPCLSPSVSNTLTVRFAMQDADRRYADGSPIPVFAETSESSQVIVLYPTSFEKSGGRFMRKGCLLSEVILLETDSAGYLFENLTATMIHELLHWAIGGQAKSIVPLSLWSLITWCDSPRCRLGRE